MLAKVDIENFATLHGHFFQEAVDRAPRYVATLCETAKTECDGIARQLLQTGRKGDVVPGNALKDLVRRNSLGIQRDLDRAGWEGYDLQTDL